MKKKKMTKAQRKEARLRKATQWVKTYNGTPKKMIKHYRDRFHVDTSCAIKDLQEIGVEFNQEYLDNVKKSEQIRINQKRFEKQRKEQERLDGLYANSDDNFCFIAGYTDSGVPYGITWSELGLEPYASIEDILDAYDNM